MAKRKGKKYGWRKFFSIKKQNRKSFVLTMLLTAAIVLFGSYILLTRFSQNTSQPPKPRDSQDLAVLYFVNQIGEDARNIAQDHDLYASVMIAQAILESNHGTSKLGSEPNYNLFGIKGDYKGDSATFQTWEDDGKGNAYKIDAQFRKYPSYTQSLEDYADLLSQNLYADTHKSNTRDFQEATQTLTGLYATDTSYNTKLNHIITLYHLTDYDQPVSFYKPGLTYNVYRQSYTSAGTLRQDNSWAKAQLEG
ncbi:glucosaminidase domain-containing protein [Streptococcus dentasini]